MKNLTSLSSAFLAVIFALLVEKLIGPWFQLLPTQLPGWSLWLLLGAILLALVLVIRQALQPRHVEVHVETLPLRTREDFLLHARKGLVLVLPTYSPFGSGPNPLRRVTAPVERLRELTASVESGEGRPLIENSNFGPAYLAVETHASQLEHCWIISTLPKQDSDPFSGSAVYADVLVRFLQQEFDLSPSVFHYGPDWQLSLVDDAVVTKRVRALLQTIYRQAARDYGLRPDETIVDFTSGFRSIPIGLILESLDQKRDLQYMATAYDANNRPTGKAFPLLFDVQVRQADR